MKRIAMLTLMVIACGGGGSSKYPSRPEGCAVIVIQGSPTVNVENIGHVSAQCDEIVAQADCLRTLKDQVCEQGGDVVWGVAPEPAHENNKWKYFGRAAHTR
jgi:hypothetical protein